MPPKKKGTETFRCEPCSANFSSQKELDRHERTMAHQYQLDKIQEAREKAQEKREKTYWVKQRQNATLAVVKQFQLNMATIISTLATKKERKKGSSLSESMLNHYVESRPSKRTQEMRDCLIDLVTKLAQICFGECTIKVYGSVVCGLDDEGSDIDVGITLKERPFDEDAVILKRVTQLINNCNAEGLTSFGTLQARVPIITIKDELSKIDVDISLRSADLKLQLFQEYLSIDPRVHPLLKAVKYWAKKRQICHSISGTINSFGYCCTAIAVLQTISPPVLPNLQLDDGSIRSAEMFKDFGIENTMSLGELLMAYFDMMQRFDHTKQRISILHGGFIEKQAEIFDPQNTLFVIEDPLEPGINFSRHVNEETMPLIMQEFVKASKRLQEGGLFDDVLVA
jgi:DNA polymerase sigma